MKNICFFNSLKFWGGGEKLHLEYAERFSRKGYSVLLAANEQGFLYTKETNEELIKEHVSSRSLSFLNPFKVNKIKKLYQKHNIDTVFFSTSQDAKLGGIAAKKAGVKNIIYLRGLAVPIKASIINKYILNKVFTHFLVNSEETARMMQVKFKGAFPIEKIKLVYHGIDIEDYDKQPVSDEFKEDSHKVILGNAGRLTQQKGQHLLLEVAEYLKEKGADFKIIIAGTGELEAELKEKIKAQELENVVELKGFVSDIKSFMSALDIFVLSSLWEGFGYVIVEAMAANKPVVAFNTSSNPEIIANNKTGYLVPEANVKSMGDKLLELINNKELRQEMGARARQSVEDRFNLDDRINEIEEYLLRAK